MFILLLLLVVLILFALLLLLLFVLIGDWIFGDCIDDPEGDLGSISFRLLFDKIKPGDNDLFIPSK